MTLCMYHVCVRVCVMQLFQTEHMRRQEERAAMERARVYVDPLSGMFPSIPPPLFPPSNPHFGIIGGEYDRNPFVPGVTDLSLFCMNNEL